MNVFAIAAVSANNVIGNQGKIPWRLPLDMAWFKARTQGGTLVMGRKTYDSLRGRVLEGRHTVVVSSTLAGKQILVKSKDGIERPLTVCDNPVKALLSVTTPEAWVCGGTQLYNALLPICVRLYITRVKQEVEGDCTFPSDWQSLFMRDLVLFEDETMAVERWIRHPEPEKWPLPVTETPPTS